MNGKREFDEKVWNELELNDGRQKVIGIGTINETITFNSHNNNVLRKNLNKFHLSEF